MVASETSDLEAAVPGAMSDGATGAGAEGATGSVVDAAGVAADWRAGTAEVWKPLKQPGNLTQRIVLAIEELVDTRQIGAGERLPAERELARLLGVSRPALREGLKILEARGRLAVRHGKGVFVRMSGEEAMRAGLAHVRANLAELFAMREALEEPAAAWAAAGATPADVARLADALAAEEEARQPPVDFERLGALDAGFHMLIVELAKNRFLRQTLDVLQEMLDAGMETTLTIPGRIDQARADHRAIFEAIEKGDAAGARQAVRKHVRGARDAALARVGHGLEDLGNPEGPAGAQREAPGPSD